MKVLIVDDEADARLTLINYLTDHCPQVTAMVEADGVATGIKQAQVESPDLILLDIQMRDGLGFEVLNGLDPQNFEVIFTTAYSEFAIKAFRYSAVDYLLKPVDPLDLMEAVQKVARRKARPSEQLASLHTIYQEKNFERIALPSLEDVRFVKVEDIVALVASNNYTTFHLADGNTHLVSLTLKVYADLLPEEHFFRIHQSYLVNLNHVTKFIKRQNSVLLTTDLELDVSKRKKPEFLARVSMT